MLKWVTFGVANLPFSSSLFQYSGSPITETNHISKESSKTQLTAAGDKRVALDKRAWQYQESALPTLRKKHIWDWDLILGLKEFGI